jgi:hypothetical protein
LGRNLLCKLERQVIGTLYPRGQAESERASKRGSYQAHESSASQQQQQQKQRRRPSSKRSKIPSEMKQAPPQGTRPTNERTNERTKAYNQRTNERRSTSDELTNEDLRPTTEGKKAYDQGRKEGRKEGRIPTTEKRTKKASTNQPANQPTKEGNDRQANEEGQRRPRTLRAPTWHRIPRTTQ